LHGEAETIQQVVRGCVGRVEEEEEEEEKEEEEEERRSSRGNRGAGRGEGGYSAHEQIAVS
jgi:hypothetical protein